MVTTSMFGDILSDQTAELTGSIGRGGSFNAALAQPWHGSAIDIAGKSFSDLFSQILPTALLINWQRRKLCRHHSETSRERHRSL
jgi:3-isopropylmalate dehydrogenase